LFLGENFHFLSLKKPQRFIPPHQKREKKIDPLLVKNKWAAYDP